jgi:hypothetical protein
MKQETLEEAAKEYIDYNVFCDGITPFELEIADKAYVAGAKSDAARDYWFEQFKKEVK